MLLLSGGWPYSVTTWVRGGAASRSLSREIPDGEEILRPLTNSANLLGYTIYPVDVPGLSSVAADAYQNPMEAYGNSIFGDTGGRPRGLAGRTEAGFPGSAPAGIVLTETGGELEQEVEGTLRFIAKETGGQPAINGDRLTVLSRASADTRSYYWLGFSPAWQGDDRRHKVEVEVLRPGLKARSRKGFLDLSPQAQVAMASESVLLFGNLPGAEQLALRVGDPVRAKGKGIEIPIILGIPVSAVTMLPIDGKYIAEAQLRFAATDERGNQSDIPVIHIRIASDEQPAEGKLLRYDTKVVLKGKASRIVASVYDPLSGQVVSGAMDLKEDRAVAKR